MYFERLSIENFLTIGEATLELGEKGLVLVQGENKDDSSADSNGSGKSSIADALSWVLYGVTARDESGDAVVNDATKKNCRVETVIRDGDTRYRIVRFRKHKTHKNGLFVYQQDASGKEIELTKGTSKLTQLEINRIMGATVEVFNASIYAGQEAMPDLPGMTDKMLKVLVEEAAGIDKLQNAHEVAKKRASDASKEVVEAEAETNAELAHMTRLDARIDEAKDERTKWVGEQTKRYEQQVKAAQRIAEQHKTLVATINSARKPGIVAELANLDTRLDGRKQEEVRQREMSRAVGDAKTKVATREAEVRRLANAVRSLRDEVQNIDARVGQPCGECGKPYQEHDLESAKRIATDRMNAEVLTLKHTKGALEQARKEAESAADELSQFERGMTDVSEVIARQKLLRDELSSIERQEKEAEAMKHEATRAVQQAKQIKAEQNPWESMVEKLDRDYAEAEKNYADWKGRLAKAQDKLAVAQACVKVFSPAGVRAHILDTVTPFLNARTSDYLGALSDGNITAVWSTLAETAKGELREKFNIAVTNSKGAKSFKGLSGGEKRKVRIATAMALQDLVASRASKPIRLFVADEVDDALDAAGLERFMGILEQKARDRGTVLVISHRELSDWIRDQVVVTKQGGKSSVSGVLVPQVKEAA